MSEPLPHEPNPYQAPKLDTEPPVESADWPLRRISGLFGLIAFAYGVHQFITTPYFDMTDRVLDVRQVWRKASLPWRMGFAFTAATLFCLCSVNIPANTKTLTLMFVGGLCLFILAMLLI